MAEFTPDNEGAWRCANDMSKFCPLGGCPAITGCARERCATTMFGPDGERVQCGRQPGHDGSHDYWQAVQFGGGTDG